MSKSLSPHYDKIIELLKQGKSNTEIAEILNISNLLVGNIKHKIKDEINIAVDIELSFEGIGRELGITGDQARAAFNNAMRKITVKCGDLELEQYLGDTTPSEFRNVGNKCSEHYSLMA